MILKIQDLKNISSDGILKHGIACASRAGKKKMKKKKIRFMMNKARPRATPERIEKATLFLRFGLPFTLNRNENGGYEEHCSNWRNVKTPTLRFQIPCSDDDH